MLDFNRYLGFDQGYAVQKNFVTNSSVYECEQLWFDLMRDLIEVKLMWIPSNVGLVGNELVDGDARYASLNGSIFDRPLSPRRVISKAWQDQVC
jgi:hypothetical protein